ncbi:hypothetical protein JHK84_055481 [Glycine max]|nr:hypothetical protein JHK86_055443 [Glycine max]KAG4918173.1 hypothetical protein JHK85_056454 [Glycine max]KAG5074250.1 hypothetical protein JHK84_055481 [Glycine max]
MVGECRMTVKKDLLLPWNHRLFTGVALLASAPRSSCINRVGQHGIQFQLEIFMTKLKGWGVRTRSFIPSGSFVCQYIGEVGDRRQSGSRLASDDDYLFHMGDGKGFINAAKSGNIGRKDIHNHCHFIP